METIELFIREFELISPPAPLLPVIKKKTGSIGKAEIIAIGIIVGLSVAYVVYRNNKKRKDDEQ